MNYREIQRVISKYYNPKDRLSEMIWRLYKDPRVQEMATWGIVEDNKDPDGYGRLKVRAPLVFGNSVSPWIYMVRPWASRKAGVWTLPDIGDAVIIGFSLRDPTKPFVMGSIPTKRTLPYLEENPGNDQKYIRTKSGLEVVMNDKEGEEELVVTAKEGKMRFVMKGNGIQIANELGDIKIKARKVTVEAQNVLMKSTKDTAMAVSDGTMGMKASKAVAQKASGKLNLKGGKVKLKGKAGVCAKGKQIAKKDDMVVGVDLHDIQVPSSSGLVTVPAIPHPYTGKLADKLSTDVTVNDKPVAVKGSKSKNNPSHIPMAPGVKFAANPNNEGEVSSGTEPSVKVNGKEAAVLGAMVKTCNDPQPQETCTIVAVGAAVALPIMPPGFDPEQYKRDGGFMVNMRDPVAQSGQPNSMTDERSLNDPKWSGDMAVVGDRVTLSVMIQSQQGLRSGVVFKVYPQGADPTRDLPVATKSVRKENGLAEVSWRYVYQGEEPLLEKPKFFFEAWAFGCEKVQSGAIEFSDKIDFICYDRYGDLVKAMEYEILEQDIQGASDDQGVVIQENLIPGPIVKFKLNEDA